MTITVNFDTMVASSMELGRIGEHNATTLTITYTNQDERVAKYRVAFQTGGKTYTSEEYNSSPMTVSLWRQLTLNPRLSIQVLCYDNDGNYIGKSAKFSGFYFAPSVSDEFSETDTDNTDIISEINQNTAARHTHSNKTVLDGLSDSSGSLVYNGEKLAIVQIQESAGRTRYTAEEIFAMSNHGTVLLYGGFVVTNVSYIGYNKVRIFVGRPATYDITYGYSVSFFCYNIENKTVSDQLYAGSTIDSATLTKARNMTSISFLIVQTLPTQNIQTNIIYLVPSTDPQTRNTYDEFIYIEPTSSWEQIGSTAVDLTGYATESWVQSQGYVTSAVTDVQDSEGNSLVTSGVATIPEIPEIPTDEEMATVLADLTNFVTLNNTYVSSGGNILAD